MYLYNIIEIVNVEPLKIGAGGSKENQTEPSKDYIPGSTIRGAIIGELIRHKKFAENQRAILSNMACYNAYPWHDDHLYVPVPRVLRMNKHVWREEKIHAQDADEGVKLTNLLDEGDADGGKNALAYSFAALKDDALTGAKVEKEYRLHHSTSRNPDKKKKENLFRYQAIAPGHLFRAIIRIEKSLAPLIQSVLERTTILYLGGAKGSGYGKCRVRVAERSADYQEAKRLVGLQAKPVPSTKRLTITCLSDCLCRNEYGQPVNHIPTGYIEELCGRKVSLHSQFVQTGITEGYNTTWRARYPKETTLKAGSVLEYEFEREPDEADFPRIIQALESRLIGHRTQDGFGWIGVNLPFPDTLKVKEDYPLESSKPQDKRDKTEILKTIKQDKEKQLVMTILVSGLKPAKDRWLNMICVKSRAGAEQGNQENRGLWISDKLKRHHLMQMRNMVEIYLKNPEDLRSLSDHTIFTRDYANDKQLCSIEGCDFSQIMEYLNDKSDRETNKRLETYAKNMLKSSKGSLFYFKVNQPEKRFIAELLNRGLYIQHRRKDQ